MKGKKPLALFIFQEGKYTWPIILYMYFMSRQTFRKLFALFSTKVVVFFDADGTKTAILKFQRKHLLNMNRFYYCCGKKEL